MLGAGTILLVTLAIVIASLEDGNMRTPSGKTPGSFVECVNAGYPVTESYPRQCLTPEGSSFTEDIPQPIDSGASPAPLADPSQLISVTSPLPYSTATNPLIVSGNARGYWFFEASFPIELLDETGNTIARSNATAEGDWMTDEFVPFSSTISWATTTAREGTLRLHRDNPSGEPSKDASIDIPIVF
jgi:hypothetical protein